MNALYYYLLLPFKINESKQSFILISPSVPDGLTGGQITGIVFGVLIGFAVLGVGGYFGLLFWKRRNNASEESAGFSNNMYDSTNDYTKA